MAFAFYPKTIHCPNCHFEGRAKILGTSCAAWILLLGLFFISFLFWPLFIVDGLLFLWLLFKPARQICPICKYPAPVPLSQWEKYHPSTPPPPDEPKTELPTFIREPSGSTIKPKRILCKHCGNYYVYGLSKCPSCGKPPPKPEAGP